MRGARMGEEGGSDGSCAGLRGAVSGEGREGEDSGDADADADGAMGEDGGSASSASTSCSALSSLAPDPLCVFDGARVATACSTDAAREEQVRVRAIRAARV